MGMSRVVDFGPKAEAIPVLIHSTREMIVQRDPIDTEFWKCVQLVWFGDAIVVGINPQAKFGVDRVAGVNDAVTVSAVLRLVEYGQGEKSIGVVGRGLGSNVSKQLRTIVDFAVAVPVQSKERVCGTRGSPTGLNGRTCVKEIEFHPACIVGKAIPRTVYVDNDWGTATYPAITAAGTLGAAVRSAALIRISFLYTAGVGIADDAVDA
jgi:hypothetical protein